MRNIASALVAFFLSLVITRLMIAVGPKYIPNERSSHTIPTPKGGGIGIIIGLYGSLWVIDLPALLSHNQWMLWYALLLSALVSAVIAFIDDLKPLNPVTRLLCQILISLAFLGLGASCETLAIPHFGEVTLGKIGFTLSLLWLVGFMNSYNFMDGLHGMLALTTLISCIFLALIFSFHINILFALSILMLCAATCGFTRYNIPQARIFISDVGSQFLGFILGGFALLGSQPEFGRISFWTFPLLFFMFLYNTAFTLFRKGLKKQNILIPHREFLFHLLNRSGWSHMQVSLLYGGFALVQGGTALLMQYTLPTKHPFFYLPFFAGAACYTIWVLKKAKKAGVKF